MENIIFLIFRRMRQPLLTLTMTYAIAVLGLVLIPGQDADGNPWHMDFFHAFYFVSYTATTIGFGEIPYPFTGAQRMWVIFSLYATVIVWIYSIGTLLALIQDKTFQEAITEGRFARRIRHMREPFYIVCGYGETGSALVHALTERNQNVVVIDIDPARVSVLQLENLRQYVPGLHGDAARPVHLLEAGLEHPQCRGVVAVTNFNEVNLKIAITSKLLNAPVKVICRADSHEVEANMASFGTNYIIDPFDTFAKHLATALQSPGLHLLHRWLTGIRYQPLSNPIYPPNKGLWIVCGYGRFGKAIHKRLRDEGIDTVIVEATPEETGLIESRLPEDQWVLGWGTEAVTLEEAGIGNAVGLVAGTDNDSNNLSIIMTAKELNPNLFFIARQNNDDNEGLFNAIDADIVMHPSSIIANKIRVLLGTPLLYEFISLAMYETDGWACELVSRVSAIVHDQVPEVWEITIDEQSAYAVNQTVLQGGKVTLGHLLTDPQQRDKRIEAIPLLRLSEGSRELLPAEDDSLKRGDRRPKRGRLTSRYRMERTLDNEHALNYILTGQNKPRGWVWQLLSKKKTNGAPGNA